MEMEDWLLEEIFERRPKGSNRSEYVREAIAERMAQEDQGTWPVASDGTDPHKTNTTTE